MGFSLLIFSSVKSQNQYSLVQFSQYRAFINHATITASSDINAAMVYRNQWVGFSGAPVTSLVNIHAPFRASNNFLGASVMMDQIGVRQNIQISGTYAYRAKFDRYSDISFAISPSINLLQGNFADITGEADQMDPTFATNENTVRPNFAFGAFYDSKYAFLGVSSQALLNNLNGQDVNGTTSDTRGFLRSLNYNIMGGIRREFASKWTFYPSFLFSHAMATPMNLEATFVMNYLDNYGGGVSYNTSNNLSFLFNIKFNSTFKLAYAYTFNLGQVSQVTTGSQEIMLIIAPKRRRTIINMPKLLEEYKEDHKKDLGSSEVKSKKQEEKTKATPEEGKSRQPYTGKGDDD